MGAPIEGVVFDFHATLVDGGSAARWLADAQDVLRSAGTPASLDAAQAAHIEAYLEHIWENTRVIDPDSTRDLSTTAHRTVWEASMQRCGGVDAALSEALYVTMASQWLPYDDTLPTLRSLRALGVRAVVLSNIGIDIRPLLASHGISSLVEGAVLSYEVGVAKPDPAIFQRALSVLDVPAERALMVGDSWLDDGGAAALGIRTLLLPRTRGPIHGLDLVLRLFG